MKPVDKIELLLDDHVQLIRVLGQACGSSIADLASDLVAAYRRDGRLIVFGNGGSAADAQHFAGELTGHFKLDRDPLPALALTTDTSVMTAIANDYGYEDVFARQVLAHCRSTDVALGISTSGESESVVRGIAAAREVGARTWALTGEYGGRLARESQCSVRVPSQVTARIQEMHITVIHIVSELVEDAAVSESLGGARRVADSQ